MKKRRMLIPLALGGLVLVALLSGCSMDAEERLGEYGVAETIPTYWFDFSLDQVDEVDSYDGYHPRDDSRLVVCRLSLENTFDETVDMAKTDFFLLWSDEVEADAAQTGLEDMVGTYALPQFSQGQLPDSYQLAEGERLRGDLVFEVPREVTQVALVYEEYYVDEESATGYSVGDHYTVRFSLGEDGA